MPKLFASLLLALGLSVSPAYSDPYATWGASWARLQPCSEADACVVVHNALSASPDVLARVLEDQGLVVEVVVINGPGKEPDLIQINPPKGWLAKPLTKDMEEDTTFVFELFMPNLS